jgi:hypothetical protein
MFQILATCKLGKLNYVAGAEILKRYLPSGGAGSP